MSTQRKCNKELVCISEYSNRLYTYFPHGIRNAAASAGDAPKVLAVWSYSAIGVPSFSQNVCFKTFFMRTSVTCELRLEKPRKAKLPLHANTGGTTSIRDIFAVNKSAKLAICQFDNMSGVVGIRKVVNTRRIRWNLHGVNSLRVMLLTRKLSGSCTW